MSTDAPDQGYHGNYSMSEQYGVICDMIDTVPFIGEHYKHLIYTKLIGGIRWYKMKCYVDINIINYENASYPCHKR